ncbi:hypothetical protein T01_9229 [Trichinella spiralis]|uniref:PiggyBac transposable element-derived protein domain-containing protein n=2 Tax=Trichinella spiralis TaxID=6334 RepID=A0A0V1AQD8_TRISP|nr:hypothetical protein T01_9229 [Trichinella spiralis]
MLTVAAQVFIAAWKQNAEDLLAKKTTIVGTLWRNKKEVPSELTEVRGYIQKRMKCVLLMSTMHHDDAVNEDQERKQDIIKLMKQRKSENADNTNQNKLELLPHLESFPIH